MNNTQVQDSVTVYSKPGCVQCNATKKQLDKLGVSYDLIDVSQDDTALDHVMALGYQQVPVVEVGDSHWGGFRVDRLKSLAQHAA